jgi:hypothetical protein
MRRGFPSRCLALVLCCAGATVAQGADRLRVGFGKADITPEVGGEKTVWIAGYGQNRKAAGVHDPILARAVVLQAGATKVALVSVDLVGFMYPNTKNVRQQLKDFDYVLVASTHNHEGPDTIGLWGPSPRESGVDPAYLTRAERGVIAAVRAAESALAPANAEYGTAEDESLLRDVRLPIVKDGVLRVLRFTRPGDGREIGLLVQWNCHPELLGGKNPLISADFVGYVASTLEKAHGCPVAYFTGAVGGLMTGPEGRIKTADGHELKEGDFAYAQAYGAAVAALAESALRHCEPLTMTPVTISAQAVAIPLANPAYRLGRMLGVLDREAFTWTGDPHRLGPPVPARVAAGPIAIETEVGYLRFGDLHVAAIPGELYPELVYGHYQEPVEPNVDFPTAPLEPPVMRTLPGAKTLLFGLANDEVGYIIPKRQWDAAAPFAYGRQEQQYGEVNSVGPETAPILMKALEERVRAGMVGERSR